jgi:hypothetical protein
MKKIIMLILAIYTIKYSSAQLTKYNWLVGGTGLFNSNKYTNDLGIHTQTITNIQLAPNIGYFFVDKFAVGLKLNFSSSRNKNISTGASYNLGKYTTFGFGPFLRYYCLDVNKQFNILIDGSYQYNIERIGGVSSNNNTPVPVPTNQYTKNTFSIAAGPVIYFNTSVGLEFLIGYATSQYAQNSAGNSGIQIGLGLQVHLERDK